jgi:hypothetical protein
LKACSKDKNGVPGIEIEVREGKGERWWRRDGDGGRRWWTHVRVREALPARPRNHQISDPKLSIFIRTAFVKSYPRVER